ncbi:MAG: phosphoglucosamine mutase, partial [Xanthomonadales bacterium]|nr:phosphoglucosamine mutase [Xanthomonadales bacterium]
LGLELALQALEVPFLRTAVGDRFIHQTLVEKGWVLGGEASGHMLCLDRTSTGDGIVSALQVLEVMARSGRSLAELCEGMQKMPQVMINVPVAATARARLEDCEPVRKAREAVEARMGTRGRVILRSSGTEPLIRVTLEGEDGEQVQQLAEELAAVVRQELG